MREIISKYSEKELSKMFPQTANNAIIRKGTIIKDLLKNTETFYNVLMRNGTSVVVSSLDNSKKLMILNLDHVRAVPLYEIMSLKRNVNINQKVLAFDMKGLKRAVENTISRLYPKERFEVKIEESYKNSGTLQIIIHYPEMLVTNEFGSTHLMKDLFLKFYIKKSDNNSMRLYGIKILRSTYSINEIDIGGSFYVFSHHMRQSDPLHFYGDLCFGSSNPVSKMINNYSDNIDFTQIQSFIMAMESYFSWESIEGTPYIKMDEFFSRTNNAPNFTEFLENRNGMQVLKTIVKEMISDSSLEHFEFTVQETYEGDKIFVKIDDNLIKSAIEVIVRNKSHFGSNFKFLAGVYKKGTVIYDDSSVMSDRQKRVYENFNDKTMFLFNDKEIKLTIEVPEISETEKEEKYILNPTIKEYISEYLGQEYAVYLLNKKLYGEC